MRNPEFKSRPYESKSRGPNLDLYLNWELRGWISASQKSQVYAFCCVDFKLSCQRPVLLTSQFLDMFQCSETIQKLNMDNSIFGWRMPVIRLYIQSTMTFFFTSIFFITPKFSICWTSIFSVCKIQCHNDYQYIVPQGHHKVTKQIIF